MERYFFDRAAAILSMLFFCCGQLRQRLGATYSLNRAALEGPSVNQQDLDPHLLGLGGPACLPSALHGALLCRAAFADVFFLGLA